TNAGTSGTGALSTKLWSAGGGGADAFVLLLLLASLPPHAASIKTLDMSAACGIKRILDERIGGRLPGAISWISGKTGGSLLTLHDHKITFSF
ncbi:hypothetical protein, partial [Paraburkholderia sp. 2C]